MWQHGACNSVLLFKAGIACKENARSAKMLHGNKYVDSTQNVAGAVKTDTKRPELKIARLLYYGYRLCHVVNIPTSKENAQAFTARNLERIAPAPHTKLECRLGHKNLCFRITLSQIHKPTDMIGMRVRTDYINPFHLTKNFTSRKERIGFRRCQIILLVFGKKCGADLW